MTTADPCTNDGPDITPVRRSQGAVRMENIYQIVTAKRSRCWIIAAAILLCAWAFTFSSMTVSLYAVQASSYFQQQSSVLATTSIISSVLGAIAKPFFARVADRVSRQATYLVVLALYIGGYVLAASSINVAMYVTGSVLTSVGDAGLLIADDIVVADLAPLEWRGYASAMLATPYLVDFWFTGKVVDLLNGNWRWGYGMFAVVMPAALLMCVVLLFWLERRLKKPACFVTGDKARTRQAHAVTTPFAALVSFFGPGDFPLLVLGLAYCLMLLPFSLNVFWEGGWLNSSIIAMLAVGCVLFVLVTMINMRQSLLAGSGLLRNRTFVIIVFIQSVYMIASNIRGLYWSTYVLIAKPWSLQNWTYYANIPLLASTLAGLVVGLLQRVIHRYRILLVVGLMLKVVALGLLLQGNQATLETTSLVIGVLLCGIADATVGVCCRVAAQASVSHDEVAHALAIYALWPKIANAIGAAVVGTIWSQCLPVHLRALLPPGTPEEKTRNLLGNPTYIRSLDMDAKLRVASISAYRQVLFYCLMAAIVVTAIPLVVVYFVSDYYLGKKQNAVDGLANGGNPAGARSG